MFPLTVAVDCPDFSLDQAHELLDASQKYLDQSNDLSNYHRIALQLAKNQPSSTQPSLKLELRAKKKSGDPVAQLSSDKLSIYYDPTLDLGLLSKVIADHIDQTFAEERAVIGNTIPGSINQSVPSGVAGLSLDKLGQQLERRKARSMKYADTYHLTFSLLTPEGSPSDWEAEQAFDEVLRPLVKGMRLMHDFTIDFQAQPYSTWSASVQPVYHEARKAWILQRSDLHGFINAAEWPLNPNIRPGPTLNFILFVPPASHSPLLVDEYESNSWLIPQWGSVVIQNLSSRKDSERTGKMIHADLREAFHIFSRDLIALLGLPAASQPLTFRILSQMRLLSIRLIASAGATLGSTARLTESLPSISIPSNVASAVDTTIYHLEAACSALQAGSFHEALHHAKIAEQRSDKAFFDKSMVGQAYFPEEHKVAVYLPLMGPVAVPLLMTAVKELKTIGNMFRAQK